MQSIIPHSPTATSDHATGCRGAMFGLDARIALGIFAVIAMVTGLTLVLNIDDQRAKALATELADTGRAIEAIHYDLRDDLFRSLDSPSEKNAFMALYNNGVVTERGQRRGRWNGPYIRMTSNIHPNYGEMVIQKQSADHTKGCTNPNELCYVWLVYSKVKPGVVTAVNEAIDGKEQAPATEGRLQWTEDSSSYVLYYRATKALTPGTD